MTNHRASALIVDPGRSVEPHLGKLLTARHWSYLPVEDDAAARRQLAERLFHTAFVAIEAGGGDLARVIAAIGNVQPHLPVVLVTDSPSTELAQKALESGAFDLIESQPREARLILLLARALEYQHLRRQLADLSVTPHSPGAPPSLPAPPRTGGAAAIVPIRTLERRAIEHALRVCGSVAQAARRLGISEATIYRKIKRYRLPTR